MVRRLLAGLVVVSAMGAWTAVPAAAQSAGAMCRAYPDTDVASSPQVARPLITTSTDGEVTFTIGVRKGESTLRAEGKGVTLFKRLTTDRVQVRVDVPGDWFELEADTAGTARLTRNGRSTKLQMTVLREEVAKAQQFAAGSKALAGLESLASALESSTSAEAQSVMTSFALLHAVRGSVAPARAVARSIKARQAAGVVRASWLAEREMPYDCWMSYSAAVGQYLVDYASCYLDYGWLPGMQAVCTFEWVIKAELAWFWLLGCSNGIPTV